MEVIRDFSEDVLQGLHLSGRKSESKGLAFSQII